MKIKNIGIKGIGSYVPKKVLTNLHIDQLKIGTNSDWTSKKLGINQRHIVEEENASDLAYHATINAINNAGLTKEDIDLLIVATSSPDRLSPSTACIVANKLNVRIPAFDINAVCSGFVYGLQLATNLINSGQYKNIVLVAAETYSKITDWSSRNCVFFGDGSGAVIISNTNGGWISTDIYSDPTGINSFTCHHSEKFKMDGTAVYNFATEILPKTIQNSLNNVGLTIDNVDWVIPHQPSHKILFKTAETINISVDKFIFNMSNFANTAGASIPMALDNLYKDNKIKSGNILILPAVGSGWTYGVSIIKWF
jgi:3-oxoacyl-[acyl-carrier-protein] synthase-3